MTATAIAKFLAGFGLLVVCAEMFVRAATRLARLVGVPPLVVGLTVVALGTTAPEIAVSVISSLQGKPDIALGNVVGSNILNVLLILGVSAVIAPLTVSRQLIRLDVPVMIGMSVLVILLAMDGGLGNGDGLILLGLAVVYTGSQVVLALREKAVPDCEFDRRFTTQAAVGSWQYLVCGALILLGAGGLVLGSHWLVQGAVAAARALGLSEMIIGLTIVAVGTSLPEVATSIIASVKGERDIAVGNVVGSNIYNLLAVLGAGAVTGERGLTVSDAALRFDLPVLVGVAMACLPIFFTGNRVSRPEGVLFLFYYLAYTIYLVLASGHHDSLPAFSTIMLAFVMPGTVIGVGLSVYRSLRRGRRPASP